MNLDRNTSYGIITSKYGYVKKILHPESGKLVVIVQVAGVTYKRNRTFKKYLNASGEALHWRFLQ